MKTYKILKIYTITAESKTEALAKFGQALSEDEYLATVIVKEDEPKGFFNAVKKQVLS